MKNGSWVRNNFVKAVVAIIIIIFLIFAYYQFTRTSWLEAFSLLNPPSGEKPPLTPTISPPLLPQKLIVNERWGMGTFSAERTLLLPEGFKINLFASGLGKARMMALDGNGNLYITIPTRGQVAVLPDENEDGFADEIRPFAENLGYPTGIAFHKNHLYVASSEKIFRMKDEDGDLEADSVEAIVSDLPAGGNHITRTIAFTREGRMLVSVGSACNVCEDDPRRAAVLQFDENGENEKIFASGLRNAVGMILDEKTGEIWVTDNGRDFLGDELPPEEVDIVKEGKHYGWPYCYGNKIEDKSFYKENFCHATKAPIVSMQAHSAPLGLRFYFVGGNDAENRFPPEYDRSLFIAFHGSWNRREPTGYKIVNAKFFANETATVSDFLTGFLINKKAWGRPVDVIFSSKNEMFVSDDFSGAIYRIVYSRS